MKIYLLTSGMRRRHKKSLVFVNTLFGLQTFQSLTDCSAAPEFSAC